MADDNEYERNQAWANVFSKILKTGKRSKKKNLILIKAIQDENIEKKKLKKIKLEKKLKERVEVVDEKGQVKPIKDESDQEEVKVNLLNSKKKSDDQSILRRVKPSQKEKERENYLNSIATQGVVQLFNAVEKYQVKVSYLLFKLNYSKIIFLIFFNFCITRSLPMKWPKLNQKRKKKKQLPI